MDTTEKHTEEHPEKKRKLFSDISMVQVTATALAAVTSMFLANYIGIAGSLIGAAVASVISTTAASLYKKILADSTEKIKELPDLVQGKAKTEPAAKTGGDDAETAEMLKASKAVEGAEDQAHTEALPQADARDGSEVSPITHKADSPTLDLSSLTVGSSTLVLNLDDEHHAESLSVEPPHTLQIPEKPKATHTEDSEAFGDTAADEAAQRKTRHVRTLIIVCVVSALLAVAATASIIYVATMGEGIGEKPQAIVAAVQQAHQNAEEKATNIASNTNESTDDGSDDSSDDSSSATNTNDQKAATNTNATNENTANAENANDTSNTSNETSNEAADTNGDTTDPNTPDNPNPDSTDEPKTDSSSDTPSDPSHQDTSGE